VGQFRVPKSLRHLPDDLQDYIHFSYLCGWRRGEVAILKWAMLDMEARVLHLPGRFSKNGLPRKIPLEGELWEIVSRRWEARRITMPTGEVYLCPYVFYRKHGRGILGAWRRVGEFRRSWKAACIAAGVPDKIFHDFRRTAVRNLIRSGVSENVAMLITGHRSNSVFQRYNITSDDDLRDAMRKVDKHVAGLAKREEKRQNQRGRFGGVPE
jgi:integrase